MFLIAIATLAPMAALASGEVYSWKDTSTQAIEASGGAYATAVELAPVSGQPGAYSASAQITCGATTNAATVTATLANPSTTPGTPVAANVTTSPATPCATNSLDASVQIGPPGSSATVSGSPTTASSSTKCDQGALSWAICPVLDKIEQTISWAVTKVVEPLLRINALSPSGTSSLYSAWSSVRNLADVLLVVILLFIIGANVLSFGLDSYTIKRALPRLVVAAVAIQFSFMVASLLVDLSNILGAGAGNLILGTFQPGSASGGGAVVENIAIAIPAIVVGIGLAITSWMLLFPMLVGLLIGVFAFFLTLGARLLLVAVLVVISPLAFVAYILPNTNSYYKQWQKLFIRLLLMYPIIMVLLGVAGRLNELLSFTDETSNNSAATIAISLLKPFIFIYLFALIPKTFKWAGSWMASFSEVINKYRDKGIAKNKESGYYKDAQAKRRDRQQQYTRKLADSSMITSLSNSNSWTKRKAGEYLMGAAGVALGGASTTPLAFNRAYSKQMSDYRKELDDLTAANNPGNLHNTLKSFYGNDSERAEARKALLADAPSMLRYTDSQASRMALINKLADMGLTENDDFERIRKSGKLADYGLALAAAGKNRGKQPAVIPRLTKAKPDYEIKDALKRPLAPADLPPGITSARGVGDVDIEPVKGMVGRWSAAALADNEKVSTENFKIFASDSRAGKDFAYVLAEKAPISEFEKAYNPNNRNFMDLEKRVLGLQGLQMHKELYRGGRGELVKEAMLKNLQLDSDLLIEAGQLAGLSRAQAEANDPAVTEAAIKRWIG